jgi:D-alanyl-D-alanine carboxypeptidase
MKIETKHSKMFFYFLSFAFLALLVYSIMIYSNQVYAQNQNHEELPDNFAQTSGTTSTQVETTKEKIEASTFVIYDINNQKIIRSQNALAQLPIASLTKIITVGTFLDTAKKSNIELREETKAKIKSALVQSSNKDADILGYIYKNSFDKDLLEDSNKFIQGTRYH